ncbi:hypothetical protein [Halomonas ventosae]|uniref:hypothetical protein n=1 Tax=Halomonas ventosae TaxID=229007 RepID=UPI0011B29290|nr:hypothetical protein [Halomonas ventosae]
MWKGIVAFVLMLVVAAPAQAEKYDCEFGRYTYHQALPCDDPEGHVYQLRKEEREKKRQELE